MAGTRIREVALTRVVDGNTLKVMLRGREEWVRLACLDAEESRPGGGKPVSNAGRLAAARARQFFGADEAGRPLQPACVDIEFDTDDPLEICLQRHRGNYGRLIGYVHRDKENYNLRTVAEGWSPYFTKYGRSRLYHPEFLAAEADAQAMGTGLWDRQVDAGRDGRDYARDMAWWAVREGIVQDYRRHGRAAGAKSVRLDYAEIRHAAERRERVTVLCDLQGGINRWTGNGAIVFAGSPQHRFNLWIPDRDTASAQTILRLLTNRYTGFGRSYLYVCGEVALHPFMAEGAVQMVLADTGQLMDGPPNPPPAAP